MIARSRMLGLQRWAAIILAADTVLLLANSLFLYSHAMPEGIVAWMQRVHVALGFGLAAGLVLFVVPHLALHLRHRNQRAKVFGFTLVAITVVASGLGIALTFASGAPIARSLLHWHQWLFVAAIAGYMSHRLAATETPAMRQEFAAAGAILLLVVVMWGVQRSSLEPRRAKGGTDGVATAANFGATNARTTEGHWLGRDDLGNPDYCAQCHKEIAKQWDGSAHHFSSLNDPFYLATFESLQKNRSPDAAKFCGGCHDPLVTLTGNMEGHVSVETPNATAGITCLACHAITEARDRRGNAGYVVAAPEHYPFYGSQDPAEQEQNRMLIRTKPEKHKRSFMKPLFRTSEFCLNCHKAHLDVAVNQYRWKRGQNDFDPWFESSAALKSARTFYNGKEFKRCQDCHMPDVPTEDPAAKDGLSRDHTFAGANTALAMVTNRPAWMEKTRKMLVGCASIDVFAAVVDADAPGERRLYPLHGSGAQVAAGETLRVDVLVRNRKVGHMFPGGTADLNEPWVEFTVDAGDRNPRLVSGELDERGHLDPSAHRFNAVFLTRDSRKLRIHEVEDFYTTLYANTLLLGASDALHYEVPVPASPGNGRLRITARLLYRKFDRAYTEFALGPDAPQLPVSEIARDEVVVAVGADVRTPKPGNPDSLAGRMNDYGIAHLRQGDTRVARWAFEREAELRPGDADTWVNLARVDLQEGSLASMEAMLRKADAARPGYFKTAYFLGRLRTTQGRFDEANAAYDLVLLSFPEDREVLAQKGIALFKAGRPKDAVASFDKVLAIDPEDVTSHSYLGRCYAALGDRARSRTHTDRSQRYRTELNERVVTEKYRRSDPDGDREANPQHVHPLKPAAKRARGAGAVAMQAGAAGGVPPQPRPAH